MYESTAIFLDQYTGSYTRNRIILCVACEVRFVNPFLSSQRDGGEGLTENASNQGPFAKKTVTYRAQKNTLLNGKQR